VNRVVAIVGPTAVGKSRTAMGLAKKIGGEIVSIDSMQIYRGMDIGTDKATPQMQARIPHHLLDVKDPSEDVTVAEYQTLARVAVDDIVARGHVPVLVGGSGLYFRAVVDDLRFPPRAEEVRAALEEEAETIGPEALHARLTDLDPLAAQRIDATNLRRTIRALEVIEITGRPFSENDSWDRYESIYDLRVIGLERERSDLHARIAYRVAVMFKEGLIDEARDVAAGGMGRTARMALGYRQILDRPEDPPDALKEAIVKATRRFARRQESWFRSDPRVRWIDAEGAGGSETIAEYLS
jgi:tRNA dimethylallyltransferase